MYRAIPVVNKACTDRINKKNHELHRKRLRSIRPSIDNTLPETCYLDHVRVNLKKEQLMEDRYNEIDRDNRILLNKMSNLLKKEQHPVDRAALGSLNRNGRKKELNRITTENHAILGRIQRVQPYCTVEKWDADHRRSNEYIRNRCEYPPPLLKKKMSRSCSSLAPLAAGGTLQSSGSVPNLSNSQVPARLDASATPCIGLAQEKPGQNDPDTRAYLLKDGRVLGNRYFLVEMSTDGRTLTISAYDGDSQKSLELILSEKNHRKIYRECNGDYGLIAARIRLVLVGEKAKEEKLAIDYLNGGLEHGLGPAEGEEGKTNWALVIPGGSAPAAFQPK